MIAAWLAIAALALAAFAFAAIALKLPREAYTLFGAVLVFGLAGYAWQGSPELPAAPKPAAVAEAGTGAAMVEGRAALFSRTLPPPDYILTSDAFARRGQFADEVAAAEGVGLEGAEKGLRRLPPGRSGAIVDPMGCP